jgi:hypothetical protein
MKYRMGYKYQLETTEKYDTGIKGSPALCEPFLELFANGKLVILRGYAWDGPSGPSFDTHNFMRGSLVHDALYQLMGRGNLSTGYKEKADRLLQQICIEDGMCSFRAWYVYQAVRFFGSGTTVRTLVNTKNQADE